MGQKVHPVGFRVGISRGWDSVWFAEKQNYARQLHEDIAIRKYLKTYLHEAGISRVIIERVGTNNTKIFVHAAKPGFIHSSSGVQSRLNTIQNELKRFTSTMTRVYVIEVRKADLDAQLVAEGIASQLEKRVSFRRAMKKAVQQALKNGAQGIKVMCSGRLGGADMSRTEWYREGRVPLHTLRANIDYGVASALTTYGITGVKIWIYKGEFEAE